MGASAFTMAMDTVCVFLYKNVCLCVGAWQGKTTLDEEAVRTFYLLLLSQKPILFSIFAPLLQGNIIILCTVGIEGQVLMNLNERLNLFSMFYLFFQGLGSKLNRRR